MESCTDINSLPEDCIANILSLTSPTDVCRLSAVSPTFRSAALSNVVWECFLPSDYRQIMSRSSHASLLSTLQSRKDLYMYLCRKAVVIDHGRKSFWLDKRSGNICYMLAARDLAILWGDEPAYWQWMDCWRSRFDEVVKLIKVCLFEIWGKINISMLSPGTKYAAYLVYQPHTELYSYSSRPMLRGFCDNPIKTIIDKTGQKRKQNTIFLEKKRHFTDTKRRSDGGTEVELGELFTVGGEDGEFEIGLMEVETGNWKSGLIVQGIEIRPKKSS